MSYMFESEQAREHFEYELNARADYLSEAFGAEARLLDEQARDERENYLREEQAAFEAFVGPRLPVAHAEPIGPSLDEDLPF